jgi:hypothetical protein
MINDDLKFDYETAHYPIVLGESVPDRIVRLLADESCDYVFKDIYSLCQTSLMSTELRQSLADHIAQVYSLNVFATGTVPKEHDWRYAR